jgi:hypothetical protein
MRKSPGVVTEALMHASATDDEKVEDARCKQVRLTEGSTAQVEGKRKTDSEKQAKKTDSEKQAKKTDSEKQAPGQENAADDELTVGCIVIVSVTKEKARFDNWTAEVLRLGKTDKVRVKMLDGPAAGVAKDFPRCSLKLLVTEETVPEEDEQETKRRKMAADLFGATL